MCGLYALYGPNPPHREELAIVDRWPDVAGRYRIPPSSLAPVIRQGPDGRIGADLLRWGLVPHWAKDETIARKLINARGETVGEKPSFRSAYRKRRCIVPASGFYEWQPVAGQKWKQPWYFQSSDGLLLGMGGLWESWTRPDGEIVRTYCIVTTAANELMRPIHDRMPVLVGRANWKLWLDPQSDPAQVAGLLAPADGDVLTAWPVSRRLATSRDDGPELIAPVQGETP